ncbi:hypothetical protein IM538_05675 [Cytobacillus suaedae]|nr:hypothetical protein IM538_05675 [Cytobacillus suaedae]
MKPNRNWQEVLVTIKEFQERFHTFLTSLNTRKKYDETVPFMLYLKEGQLVEESGSELVDGVVTSFKTHFFRIEAIDTASNCAYMTLLKPLDLDSKLTMDLSELYRLERTFICVELEIDKIGAVQPLSPRIINRELPIKEPVWDK